MGQAEETVKKNFWKHRSVFVTGATGLLGSWLTEALVSEKAQVVALVRDGVSESKLFQEGLDRRITIVRGCVEDLLLLERILNEYAVETVFHLAAQTIVGTANRSPLSTFETNVRGTWNLLEACRRTAGVRRIVMASSDKAYGQQRRLPYDEGHPLEGRHPYDVSKSCADLLATSYARSFRLPVVVARCANFFGGGDLNFNRLIPGTIRSVLLNERPIIRSDGRYVRDYLYIKDAVRAYLELAQAPASKVCGEAFNFSSGVRLQVSDVVALILRLMKRRDLKPRILRKATNEIRCQYLSSRKAAAKLGWKPHYTFQKGLAETILWYEQRYV